MTLIGASAVRPAPVPSVNFPWVRSSFFRYRSDLFDGPRRHRRDCDAGRKPAGVVPRHADIERLPSISDGRPQARVAEPGGLAGDRALIAVAQGETAVDTETDLHPRNGNLCIRGERSARDLQSGDASLVRGDIPSADTRAGARLARNSEWRERARPRADRLRKNARGCPPRHRPSHGLSRAEEP